MNIATVAADTIWKDPKANIEDAKKHVTKVLEMHPKTDVILFPEISLLGTMEEGSAQAAESMDGPSVAAIKRIAKEHQVALICGIIEKNPNGKPYNTIFVIDKNGELLASYRKNHLFTESKEPEFYTPGQELVTFDLAGWKCGLSICFDIRFPRLFATYKKAGVECMFSGFNWVQGRNKPAIMEYLVKARAHENQYFFAAVDRNGSDPGTSYYGTSVITNPYCEDISAKSGIYAYAEITKDDIQTLGRVLPLTESFKPEYTIKHGGIGA